MIPIISSVTAEQSTKFSKNQLVWIASSIAIDLSVNLTQNNSLPTALLTNRLIRVTAVVTIRNLCAVPSDWNAFLGSYTEFFSPARQNFYIYRYLSHRQHC